MQIEFLESIPVQKHKEGKRRITILRADLVPQPPLPPYVKMIEVYPFIKAMAKRGVKLLSYYAVPESGWVTILPKIGKHFGIKILIGMSKTKILPEYAKHIPEKCLYLMSPNMYNVNYARLRKHTEDLGGLCMPMGLQHKLVVKGLADYLNGNEGIPHYGSLIVPTGSGIALSGILHHLHHTHDGIPDRVFAICTRPTKSVAKVLDKFAPKGWEKVVTLRERAEVLVFDKAPVPMHPLWDLGAWDWMLRSFPEIPSGRIVFLNLGQDTNPKKK